MNKRKPKDQATLRIVQKEAIAEIRGEEDFVEFLRRELGWPIPYNIQKLSDVAIPHDLQRDFGFYPVEDRIAVSRLLNLAEDQPWGVFLFEFKTKKPQLSHLRKILRVLGSQKTLLKGDPIWDREDLLFICTSDWSQFQFVHFSGKKAESAVISSFGWKGPDDPFLHTLCKHNLPRLRMPTPGADGNFITDLWRETWKEAFNVKPVTDEFYATLKEVFDAVQAGITGLDGEERRFFAELVVNRLIFLKFVEKKGWLNDDRDYLYNKFRAYGKCDFWGDFLCFLFFEGLCQEPAKRSHQANEILGEVPFLNAELFSPSVKWNDWETRVNNRAFDLLFDKLLNPYNFTVCETSPLDIEVAFNQDLLGYGYEELIADQHGQGAYYTHPTEVNLMCRQSLWAYLENRCPEVSKESIGRLLYSELYEEHRISREHALTLYQALHEVTVVDPALGSGTFPVAMMKHLFLAQTTLGEILSGYPEYESLISQGSLTDHRDAFTLKLHIIERSIYGCDIDYFAVQIAKLRFWIELMVDCEHPEALPNFDCKLVVGDALVSVVGIDSQGKLITLEDHLGHPTKSSGQGDILHSIGKLAIEELGQLKHKYFNAKSVDIRQTLERHIKSKQQELLLSVGIELDGITTTDKHILWQIDFAEIFSGVTPGFDIAVANPPYLRQQLIDKSNESLGLNTTKADINRIYKSTLMLRNLQSRSDLYIYFFLRGFMLVKQDSGILSYICSNSWLDSDYGVSLQEYILGSVKIECIIDNSSTRSFENAGINTTINVLINSNSDIEPDSREEIAKFLLIRKHYERVNMLDVLNQCSYMKDKVSNQTYRLFPITHSALYNLGLCEKEYKGWRWGAHFFKAPDILIEILENKPMGLKCLGQQCEIETYLNTGGSDDFFIVNKIRETDEYFTIKPPGTSECFVIERKFLVGLIDSPSEVLPYLKNSFEPSKLLLQVRPEDNLKGTLCADYITWGEKQGFNMKSGTKNRNPWYTLPRQSLSGSKIIWPCRTGQRHVVAFNPNEIVSHRFYRIHSNQDSEVLAAFLNSTFIALCAEVFSGSSLGQGVLDINKPVLEQMPVIDFSLINYEDKCELIDHLHNLSKEPPMNMLEQCGFVESSGKCSLSMMKSQSRWKLDSKIGQIIGLDNEDMQRIRELACKLANDRYLKAQSTGKQ